MEPPESLPRDWMELCPVCRGEGEVMVGTSGPKFTCPACAGEGLVPHICVTSEE